VPLEEQEAFDRELFAVLGGDGSAGLAGGPPKLGALGLRPLSKGLSMPLMALSAARAPATSPDGGGGGGGGGATVSFKMLTRRDGRNSTRELLVPVASEMATQVAAQQEAEEAERSELKRLVLGQVALSETQAAASDAASIGRVLFSNGGARGGERSRRR
jgi:hypothetical protein